MNDYYYDITIENNYMTQTFLFYYKLTFAIMLIIIIINIICTWKIYKKANIPGYYAIIPIYNNYIMVKDVIHKPISWFLLQFVPIINVIMCFKVNIELAKKFNKSALFGIGLVLFSPILMPILAFSKNEYIGDDSMNNQDMNQYNNYNMNSMQDVQNMNNNTDLYNQTTNVNAYNQNNNNNNSYNENPYLSYKHFSEDSNYEDPTPPPSPVEILTEDKNQKGISNLTSSLLGAPQNSTPTPNPNTSSNVNQNIYQSGYNNQQYPYQNNPNINNQGVYNQYPNNQYYPNQGYNNPYYQYPNSNNNNNNPYGNNN